MRVRTACLLTGLLLFAGIPGVLNAQEVVLSPPPVKIYDTLYEKEPGRTHFQLYPREVEVVNVPDAPTIHQFAAVARPVPGWHEIIVQHPFTHQSVLIRFKLQTPVQGILASRRTLQFWYVAGNRIEIRFLPTGQVKVEKYYGPNAVTPP